MIEKLIRRIFGNDICSEFVLWRYVYRHSPSISERVIPMNVWVFDNTRFTNGFADRLRGIIAIYALSKCMGRSFRIVHEAPFQLSRFFAPNTYDWSNKEGISYNYRQSLPVVFFEDKNKYWRLFYLSKRWQWHFYTNADALSLINKKFHKKYCYSELFHELFRPSEYLLRELEPYNNYIEHGYVSISFRFMQLMGDFKDCRGKTLNHEGQESLIKKCKDIIVEIKKCHQEVPCILVTSDSQRFIDSIHDIDCVFTIPGTIGHVGFSIGESVALKTCLDFYMISQASKVYMAYSKDMYRSCFARDAAKTTDVCYEEIFIE